MTRPRLITLLPKQLNPTMEEFTPFAIALEAIRNRLIRSGVSEREIDALLTDVTFASANLAIQQLCKEVARMEQTLLRMEAATSTAKMS
jgi:hypothetical protein